MKISLRAFAVVFMTFVLTLFTAVIAAGLTTKAFAALTAGQLAIAGTLYTMIIAMGIMSVVVQATIVRAASKAALHR